MSCEAYRCACLAVFGAPAPQNHWEVIQTLSRHGFFAVTGSGHGVIQSSLLSASPFIQVSGDITIQPETERERERV